MKGTGIAIVAGLAGLLACNPPQSTGIFEPAQAEVQIRDIEREWAQVGVTADPAAAERLLADDFLGIAPDGTSYTKQALLDQLRANPAPLSANEIEDLRVRFFKNVAVVQGHESFIRKDGEKGRYAATDVLVRRDGRWRIVAAHDAVAPYEERAKTP
jgi:hypothetical protein